jgi:hypothetical protein
MAYNPLVMLVVSHVALPFHFPFSLNTPCATTYVGKIRQDTGTKSLM